MVAENRDVESLSGWGRFPVVECRTLLLREPDDIALAFTRARSLIARGNGRAYGDAALNPDATLLTKRYDRFLTFDTRTGIIECEAGVLLSDLLDVAVAHAWFPRVLPGTKFVTVGGLIAADVHGKNHHREGSFGQCVHSIRLALADGTIVTCSRAENSELFAATLGGMGLTGVILSARIQLRPIRSELIEERSFRATSLESLLQLLSEHDSATYSVAWIDCLTTGAQFGRGILMLGEHAVTSEQPDANATRGSHRPKFSVPIELPVSPLNTLTIRAFNEIYYRLHQPRVQLKHYTDFFFPLDRVANWNRIYGKSGFIQYQCVIGGAGAERGIREIVRAVGQINAGAFLAVIKKLGPGARYMSFPMEGYTITLDFPIRRETISQLAKLDAVVTAHQGRIYLAKDARAPRKVIEAGYPEIGNFRALRERIDPERKFRSVLSERLAL